MTSYIDTICLRCGDEWGLDTTCDLCTDANGDPLPIDPTRSERKG